MLGTISDGLLLGSGAALLVVGALMRRSGAALAMQLLGGVPLLLLAAGLGSPAAIVATAALVLVAGGRLVLAAFRSGGLRFNEAERRMAESVFATLDRRQARHLIDQGVWLDGKPGEMLIREGEPASHLFYIGTGTAGVFSGEARIATVAAPSLVGEITVLDESGATATVRLDDKARFWCVGGGALRLFLTENPDIRVALENSFFGSLTAKLRAANANAAGRG